MKEYNFVKGEFVAEYEIKRSRFIATICGELEPDEAISFAQKIKKKYPDARHNCFAYTGDEIGNCARFSDDGEPSGTAGAPMYEVLKKNSLVKTAVVVTRYFGGIKLGASGLLGAYTKSVADAVECADVATKKVAKLVTITADYSSYSYLERELSKDKYIKIDTNYQNEVVTKIFAKPEDIDDLIETINIVTNGRARVEIGEEVFTEFPIINK